MPKNTPNKAANDLRIGPLVLLIIFIVLQDTACMDEAVLHVVAPSLPEEEISGTSDQQTKCQHELRAHLQYHLKHKGLEEKL